MGAIDRQTLKGIIVDLRDNKGYTFNKISQELDEVYHIKKSRQAVCEMYKRTVATLNTLESKEQLLLVNDILNINVLGYKSIEIKEIMQDKLNKAISAYKIDMILSDNREQLEIIIADKVEEVKESLFNGADEIGVIAKKLMYKDIKPKDTAVKEFIVLASNKVIDNLIIDTAVSVYRLTGDINLAKRISHGYNKNITVYDIKRELRE